MGWLEKGSSCIAPYSFFAAWCSVNGTVGLIESLIEYDRWGKWGNTSVKVTSVYDKKDPREIPQPQSDIVCCIKTRKHDWRVGYMQTLHGGPPKSLNVASVPHPQCHLSCHLQCKPMAHVTPKSSSCHPDPIGSLTFISIPTHRHHITSSPIYSDADCTGPPHPWTGPVPPHIGWYWTGGGWSGTVRITRSKWGPLIGSEGH